MSTVVNLGAAWASLGFRDQYRLRWRREAWSPATSDRLRVFDDLPALRRHVEFLSHYAGGRLSPLVVVVEGRVVGPWKPTRWWRS